MATTAAVSMALKAQLPHFRAELDQLGRWWSEVALDPSGGFYGEVGLDNCPVVQAPRGLIQNARILYFFSQLAVFSGLERYRFAATHAYDYIQAHFTDSEFGGYYWSVDASGRKLDPRKHLYAQAFMLYALVAFYQMTQNPLHVQQAMRLFALIEQHGLERTFGGYLEAFGESWGGLDDTRLSELEPPAAKTMNTHLHLMEAYSALACCSKDPKVTAALAQLVTWFCQHIVNADSGHVRMFMSLQWQDMSKRISFGHDIEASWLLYKALQACGDEDLSWRFEHLPMHLARVSLDQAWSPCGGIRDEQEIESATFPENRTWWTQSEALVGYLYAWKLSGDERFAQRALAVWQFIGDHHRDSIHGEWFWFSSLDIALIDRNYKSGFWKCPYHNGRALLEACQMLSQV
jgi:cellobiose epimerase